MIYSPPDIALILGIALLVFGPKRLPELGHAIGQGIGNFKKSLTEAENSVRTGISTATSVPVANAGAVSNIAPVSNVAPATNAATVSTGAAEATIASGTIEKTEQ